jgi:hypothetical protein
MAETVVAISGELARTEDGGSTIYVCYEALAILDATVVEATFSGRAGSKIV